MPGSRLRRLAYYAVPILFCLLIHRLAVKIWFFNDDFAWLGLPLHLEKPGDIWEILFKPQAQGTIRTLSERLYFLTFASLFGLEAWPFRAWMFLTQAANLSLLAWITRRLTGSAAAGLLAPVLWVANPALAVATIWSSAYNELACVFFLLLAFFFLLRYIDTGLRRYWVAQWIAYLLGFGAMELNVVYPALAALYTVCCARRYFRRTLWLFLPAAAFTWLHFFVVPPSTSPAYKMHFGAALLTNVWNYWRMALGASRDDLVDWRPLWLGYAITFAVTAALAVFLAHTLRRHEWLGVFALGWFGIALAPLAPLTNHFTEYYLTVPMIGLAILGAWAVSRASRLWMRIAASALVTAYLIACISDVHAQENYYYTRVRGMKYLVKGLEADHARWTGKSVLMAGVSNDLFWSGFYDDPFRLLGLSRVYLAPGEEKAIEDHPEWGSRDRFLSSLDPVASELARDRAVVYRLDGRQLHDVTAMYKADILPRYAAEHASFADAGDVLYAARFGSGWYPIEKDYRWMSGSGEVWMAGPQWANESLVVSGYCPAAAVAKGPVTLTVKTGARVLGSAILRQADKKFELTFPLPEDLVGRTRVDLKIETSRTFQPASDARPLGLIFGTFAVR